MELASLENKSMYNVVITLGPSFFNRSSLFFQATKTTIISWMGSKFGKMRMGTAELHVAALECLEKFQ